MVFLYALLSAAQVAVSAAVGRHDVREQLEHQPGATAGLILRLGENSTRLLATVRIGTALVSLAAAISAARVLYPGLASGLASPPFSFSPPVASIWTFLLLVVGLVAVLVILGELVPKTWADHRPRAVARLVAWPLQLLTWLLWPLALLFTGTNTLLLRLFGEPHSAGLPYVREDEIRTLVDAGEEEGTIELGEKEMISGILEMGETLVREVMVPRTDVVALDVDTPLLVAIGPIMEAGHSRIPVYQETIDNIVGILYAKDLLLPLREEQRERPLRGLLRPAYFVPETKIVDDLLRELQRQHTHIAIVVDEYGGTAGLVTIEDLLEEIVGEIQDEYDTEEPLIEDLGDGEYMCDARLSVDDAERLAGLQIPEGDFDSLGGFVYDRLGAIPRVGDQIVVGDATITVDSIKGLRLGKLHVQHNRKRPAPAQPGEKEIHLDER